MQGGRIEEALTLVLSARGCTFGPWKKRYLEKGKRWREGRAGADKNRGAKRLASNCPHLEITLQFLKMIDL